MRIVVFLFGFPAIFLTALAGVILVAINAAFTFFKENGAEIPTEFLESLTGVSNGNAGLFFLIAATFGFLGVMMALFRRGKQGALLMLIPVLGAAFMHPYFAVLGALQLLVALLCFFIGPLPIEPQPEASGEND